MKKSQIIFFSILAAVILGIIALWWFTRPKKSETSFFKPDVKPDNNPGGTTINNDFELGFEEAYISNPNVNLNTYNALPLPLKLPVSRNDKNQLVYLLQFALNALYGKTLVLDGIWGNNTETAVVQSLKKNQISRNDLGALGLAIYKYRNIISNANWFVAELQKFDNAIKK